MKYKRMQEQMSGECALEREVEVQKPSDEFQKPSMVYIAIRTCSRMVTTNRRTCTFERTLQSQTK